MSMTGIERCRAVLEGRTPDRVPVVPQCFLLALECAQVRMSEVVYSARKMVEAQVLCQERFGYDGCVIDFDDASLAEACGAKLIYRAEEPAVVDESEPVVKDLRDLDHLQLPDPWRAGRLPVWLEATQLLVERLGDRALVMGRADQGPFTLAALLSGTQRFMMALLDETQAEAIQRLIDFSRQACARFARAQQEAGAHVTSIGDALAGPSLISPALFRRFAFEPEQRLAAEVQAGGIPLSIHICGNTSRIIGDMGATGARILEVDWQLDLGRARELVPASTVLMGNVNPADPLAFGTPAQVESAARDAIQATGGKGLWLSSGCALGRNTPPENLAALVAAARAMS